MLELVLNKISPRAIDKGMCVKIEDATSLLAIPLLGYIVEDARMQSCNNRGLPIAVARDSQLYHCFDVLARRFLKEKVALPKLNERRFLSRIFAT